MDDEATDEVYVPPVIGLDGMDMLPGDEDWIDVSVFGEEADAVFAVRQPRNVVFWPMVLHKHGNGCGRA